ncbi:MULTISPECIES: Na(+)-translocating NADH-quinone reductase subunit C [Tropicimonas]|uniref:Na(+)-translocating NADH-quinone reductase subunit C n=2 Tax=Tropicimonas TaxID=599652 RepID=A0A239EQ69_9RHOB|nr:Na(+)-translocating NADH-quinone reductase subunit C [Tropicimonas sediminicola]SNS46153.1 Na+-transporting NADH:ubiquinone oxidoreductase subunit C [Tropicimonas sediminicola]
MPEQDENQGFLARWKALPVDSVPKTIFVAAALCLFCSMVVAFAAVNLRPLQEANKLNDKRINILQVAGLYDAGEDIEEAFAAFEPRVVDLRSGTFTDEFDATQFDDRAAASDPELSRALDEDPAGIGRQTNFATVYLLNDEAGNLDKIILPIHGYGLWSTLYGFIALEDDGNQIYGLQFYDHAETPGLGAEVDNPAWKAQWRAKELRDDSGALKITVSKGLPSPDMENHQVDALAGATLTSVGVDNLVRFWMGENGFAPFLENLKAGDV